MEKLFRVTAQPLPSIIFNMLKEASKWQKQKLTNMIFYIPKVVKSAAKILKISQQIKIIAPKNNLDYYM